MFPGFRLSLPPKRWFKDNYDSGFLEDRQLGLQAFLQNLIAHKDIANWYVTRSPGSFLLTTPPPSRVEIERFQFLISILVPEIWFFLRGVTLISSLYLSESKGAGGRRSLSKRGALLRTLVPVPIDDRCPTPGGGGVIRQLDKKTCVRLLHGPLPSLLLSATTYMFELNKVFFVFLGGSDQAVRLTGVVLCLSLTAWR